MAQLDVYSAEPVNHTFLFGAVAAWWLVRTVLCKLIHNTVCSIINVVPGVKLNKKEQIAFHKTEKYIWHAIGYLVMVVWVGRVLWLADWGFNFKNMAMPFPAKDDDISEIKYLMWLQAAWYIHGFIECILYDRNRGDFALMMAHHILAVILIYGSYLNGGHRVGLMVTFEQDISDIVLYAAKVYQKATSDADGNPHSSFIRTTHTLVISIVSVVWFLTRHLTLATIIWNIWLYLPLNTLWLKFLYLLLCSLLVLQLIWGIGLFKMTIDQIVRGSHQDMWHDAQSPKAADKKHLSNGGSPATKTPKAAASPTAAQGTAATRTPSPKRSQKVD